MPHSLARLTLVAIPVLSFFNSSALWSVPPKAAADYQRIWAFQDGSLVLTDSEQGTVISFPYIPFLGSLPAWTPALSREYLQPPEPILPLPGLAGKLRLGLANTTRGFQPFRIDLSQPVSETPYSASFAVYSGSEPLKISWICPLNRYGIIFECSNTIQREINLEICLEAFLGKTIWATPGKKERHDWGESRWEWVPGIRCLLQSYSTPVDATHSPVTGLWIGESVSESGVMDPEFVEATGMRKSLRIRLPPRGSTRFGFLHSNNYESLLAQLSELRQKRITLAVCESEWKAWLAEALQAITNRTGVNLKSLPSDRRKSIENNLLITRGLFLSNGATLTEPMTPSSYPVSISEGGVALNHWRKLGLEYPFLRQLGELSRHCRVHRRSIDIPVLRKGGALEVLQQGSIILAAPDPQSPPDKETLDTLMGYVISGGHFTLVDGVHGFRGKEGWWTESGATDIADYALRIAGVPIEATSRRVLDDESLASKTNSFAIGSVILTQEASDSPKNVSVNPPNQSGYLLVFPTSADDPAGVRILSLRIGEEEFRPYSTAEDKFLANGYAPRVARDEFGETLGCDLIGEAFRCYRIPEGGTKPIEATLTGSWTIGWMDHPPQTHHTLRKKVHQSWYSRELHEVPILRLAHPAVYSGTYTCRVFDVTGTALSPFLYWKVGSGTLVWLGLPREYILLGSDTGADFENPLREDPTYDLLRLTLAFHDPKRAGGERAGRAPLSGWATGWSDTARGGPSVLNAFFAWRPVELLGWATRPMNAWVQEGFANAVAFQKSEGGSLPNTALITQRLPEGREILELADNAFVHALYKATERVSGILGREWMQEHSQRQIDRVSSELPVFLEGFGEGLVCGRVIEDGSPLAAVPLRFLLPKAAWAATEIAAADFPGGATAQAQLLAELASKASQWEDSRVLAVLAASDETHREQLLEMLLQKCLDPASGLIGREGKRFDLATAVPAIRALVLSGSLIKP